MKSKNYILSVLATGLMTGSMVSCSDFLDTKPSTSVDDTDVFQTTSGAQSALNGCISGQTYSRKVGKGVGVQR